MQELIFASKQLQQQKENLPFLVYCASKEQRIFNVPVIKPLLICVLDGCKKLGKDSEVSCAAGTFVFLSNSPRVDMRNIPVGTEYFALLIEFEFSDFDIFESKNNKVDTYFQGDVDSVLQRTLQQFVEWSAFAPEALWAFRRKEVLQLLYHLGHEQVSAVAELPSLSHKLHGMMSRDVSYDWNAQRLSSHLAMSESSLRRKLNAEGTSLQLIKDRVRLGSALNLVQTSDYSIGSIAEQCGYSSQSRFTDKFKQLFGVTPSELRKTTRRGLGE